MANDRQFNRHSEPSYAARHYTTVELYLAAYLYAHGLWLVNIKRDSSGSLQFVFRNGDERGLLVDEFVNGPEAWVDARKFSFAIEDLKARGERVQSDL